MELSMRRIRLTRDRFATVDNKDFEWLNSFNWFASVNSRSFEHVYAQRTLPNGKPMLMHRFIMGLVPGDRKEVDHKNHRTLDNQRKNLQVVTHRQNHDNRRRKSRWGVGIRPHRRRFRADARVDGKTKFIGTFATIAEAREARKIFLKKVGE